MSATRILYIEDEANLARIVRESLQRRGYEVCHSADGTGIFEQLASFQPHVCLLDVMLPHVDGFTLGSAIRSAYRTLPILFLTAKTQTADVIQGFSAGGNDYLRKPFSVEELIVRMEHLLRLIKGTQAGPAHPSDTHSYVLGSVQFFPSRHLLTFQDGTAQQLSHRESQVLTLLVQHRNDLLDRRVLLRAVWGDDSFFQSRTLDVYIRRLRAYLEGAPEVSIITLKGYGYRLSVM